MIYKRDVGITDSVSHMEYTTEQCMDKVHNNLFKVAHHTKNIRKKATAQNDIADAAESGASVLFLSPNRR